MTVSAISSGAGSVAVLARPALPNTDSTSGKVLMILSWVCNNSADLVTDKAGKVMGINNKLPSFNVGMNSLPNFIAGNTESASVTKAAEW